MDIAALFLHNMREGDCPAWAIHGDVTTAERNRIDAMFSAHLVFEQDGGFNEWHLRRADPDFFIVRRFTWSMCWTGTLDEIQAKLDEYYEPIAP